MNIFLYVSVANFIICATHTHHVSDLRNNTGQWNEEGSLRVSVYDLL